MLPHLGVDGGTVGALATEADADPPRLNVST